MQLRVDTRVMVLEVSPSESAYAASLIGLSNGPVIAGKARVVPQHQGHVIAPLAWNSRHYRDQVVEQTRGAHSNTHRCFGQVTFFGSKPAEKSCPQALHARALQR